MNNIIPFIARILIAAMFLKVGISQVQDFDGMVASLTQKSIALPSFFAASAIGMLLLGSLMVIAGFKPKLGALMLIIFLVPTTFLYHIDLNDPNQLGALFSNVSLLGGLLMVVSFGSGNISLDKMLSK